jgi:hypothetical protein
MMESQDLVGNVKITGLDELFAGFEGVVKDIDREKRRILLGAGVALRNSISDRAGRGKSIDGQSFSAYSTEPSYFRILPGMRLKPSGKTKRAKKTVFCPGGYAQLRQLLGRNLTDRLQLTGNMMSAMTVREIDNGVVIDFTNKTQRLKASGMNERYNWFGMTEKERSNVYRDIRDEVMFVLSENLK